jgi:hypothetical protein
MPLSDVRRPWQGGLASIAIGPGRGVAPFNHLGPHNALEWALYVGLFVLLVVVALGVVRNNEGAVPRVRKPRHVKTRGDQKPGPGGGSTPSGSDELSDDRDPGS